MDKPQDPEPAETAQTTSVPAVDLPRLVVPLYLWLQWHGDGTPEDDGEVCESEVTWCREKIFDHDVEYVHAAEIRRALMGHRRSELFGDKGLIAATMRCVEAVGKIEDLVTTDHETKEAFIQRVRGILGHNDPGMARRPNDQSDSPPTNANERQNS